MLLGVLQLLLEVAVEGRQQIGPLLLAVLDIVQLAFELRRVLRVEDVRKIRDQQIGHDQANLGRDELARAPLAHLLYILAFLNR